MKEFIPVIYKNKRHFTKQLRALGLFSKEQIKNISSHEEAHFKKAQALGQECHYCIVFYRNHDRPTSCVNLPKGVGIPKKDLIDIVLAPKNPSKGDYFIAIEAGGGGGKNDK